MLRLFQNRFTRSMFSNIVAVVAVNLLWVLCFAMVVLLLHRCQKWHGLCSLFGQCHESTGRRSHRFLYIQIPRNTDPF